MFSSAIFRKLIIWVAHNTAQSAECWVVYVLKPSITWNLNFIVAPKHGCGPFDLIDPKFFWLFLFLQKVIIQTSTFPRHEYLKLIFRLQFQARFHFGCVYKNKCITNDYYDFWLLAFAVWTWLDAGLLNLRNEKARKAKEEKALLTRKEEIKLVILITWITPSYVYQKAPTGGWFFCCFRLWFWGPDERTLCVIKRVWAQIGQHWMWFLISLVIELPIIFSCIHYIIILVIASKRTTRIWKPFVDFSLWILLLTKRLIFFSPLLRSRLQAKLFYDFCVFDVCTEKWLCVLMWKIDCF